MKDGSRIPNYCLSRCERRVIAQPERGNDTIWAGGGGFSAAEEWEHRSGAIRASAGKIWKEF